MTLPTRERYHQLQLKLKRQYDEKTRLSGELNALRAAIAALSDALEIAADCICMDRCQNIIGHDAYCKGATDALAAFRATEQKDRVAAGD